MTGTIIEQTTIGGRDVVLRFVDYNIPAWSDSTFAHAKYSLRIGHGEDGRSFPFWQSERGTREQEHPPIESVVSAVFDDAALAIQHGGPMSYTDDPGRWLKGLDDMADEMGYQTPSEAFRVWHAVNESAEKLLRFYTEEQLYEIVEAAREEDLSAVEIFD